MKKPFSNTTNKITHIGNVTIMPGRTRDVEEADLLAHYGAKKTVDFEPKINDPLMALLKLSVPKVKAGLAELAMDDINALETLEQLSPAPRKGVLDAITEERLTRAARGGDIASDMQQFIDSLAGMSDEELGEYAELYAAKPEDEAYLAAVKTEIENRAGNK